ncbi:MAG: hypothetical protein HQM16_06960 [Deltaproteobacteria bacterium]|nr:hypothetical protein [Deltaproteobacteria bacterium]
MRAICLTSQGFFYITPAMSPDYFKLLNLPTKLKLDHNKLKKNYFNLIRHKSKDPVVNPKEVKEPDKKEKELIKKAYETLKGRITRIEHLLEINGQRVDEDTKVPTTLGPIYEQVQTLIKTPRKNQKCINELKQLHKDVIAEFSAISIDLAHLENEWDNSAGADHQVILKKLKRKTLAFSFIRDVEQNIRTAIN